MAAASPEPFETPVGALDPPDARFADPAGLTRVALPEAGFAIQLPADWTVVDLATADVDETLELLAETDPIAADVARTYLASGPVDALVIGPHAPGDPMPPILVASQASNVGMSRDLIRQYTLASLPGMPGVHGRVSSADLDLADEPAFWLGYGLQLRDAQGAPVQAGVSQYTVVTDDRIWAFAFMDDAPAPDGWRSLAGTFEILP
jgi:hypothetical protein